MMVVLLAYQEFLQHRYPNLYGPKARSSPTATATGATEATPVTHGNAASPAQQTSEVPVTAATSTTTITTAPERIIVISTDYYEAALSTQGGRLVSFKLKKYRETGAAHSPPYEMVRPGARLPLGLLVTQGNQTIDDSTVAYSTDAPSRVEVSGRPSTIVLRAATKDGLKLEKTFSFSRGTYVFDLKARVEAANGNKPGAIGLTMNQPLTALPGYRDYPEVQVDVQGKATTEMEKALRKGVQPLSGKIQYAGFGDRYFLAAFIPQNPVVGTLTMSYAEGEADTQMSFEGIDTVATRIYMGPKALDILEHVDPALAKAIDLGFWGIIALPFLRLLKIFYYVIPNYGVAIILLTVVVRLATLPMSIKGQRSMMRMQRLQPQVERIREKFKDDSERLNREMMELYKRNHVNPIGGCLPMIVQFPVFIGLYEALLNAVDLRHAPFFGWIQDLSAPDCLHIPGMPIIPFTTCAGIPVLVALMTVSAFLQQWLMPRQADPSQQKLMMYMPVAFSLIFLSLPAGLSLYYLASNLLGIAQQVILNKEFQQTPSEAKT
jgi:YidC/Oxa1 family membrane protein insertase